MAWVAVRIDVGAQPVWWVGEYREAVWLSGTVDRKDQLMLCLIYAAGWLLTAVAVAYLNRDAAPVDHDPVGLGLVLGAIWPLFWLATLAAGAVAGCVALIERVRA